jgi:hypothetical protein
VNRAPQSWEKFLPPLAGGQLHENVRAFRVGAIPNYTRIEPKVVHFTAFLGQREHSTSASAV